MPNITYKKFYPGISQDDYVAWEWQYIDWENIDGLETWYGITLSKDVIKHVTTSTYPMYWIGWEITSGNDEVNAFVWWDWTDWYIYKVSAADNTPSHTITTASTSYTTPHAIYYINGFYVLLALWPGTSWAYAVHTISSANFVSWTWSGFSYDVQTFSNASVPPVLFKDNVMFIWYGWWIMKYTWTTGTTFFSTYNDLVSWNVVWLTAQWTTIKIYTDQWEIGYWDGAAANVSSYQNLWTWISKVEQEGNLDYIVTQNGDFYIGSGYSYQLISRKQSSKRLEDNATLTNKADFREVTDKLWDSRISFGDAHLYLINNDKTIYKYGELITWLPKWFHNVVASNNADTAIDRIYTIKYMPWERKIFFSYKAWSTYWVDAINIDSANKAQDGHVVTNIFTWWTTLKKEISEIRLTTSNTSWNNNVKLYIRIDNWTLTLIETINNATDTIARTECYADVNEFMDIQFKVELHNEAWADAPILHELQLNYDIIEETS